MHHLGLRSSLPVAGLACAMLLFGCGSSALQIDPSENANAQRQVGGSPAPLPPSSSAGAAASAGSERRDSGTAPNRAGDPQRDAGPTTVIDAGVVSPPTTDAGISPVPVPPPVQTPPPPPSPPAVEMEPPRCGDGNPILVSSQSQLDALKGCTVINGSLLINASAVSSLDALGACESIQGELIISADLGLLNNDDAAVDTSHVQIKSLAGLSRLAHAGKVDLRGLHVTTLKDLSSLRTVFELVLQQLDVTDLRGLEQATWHNLRITRNATLQSLQGLGSAEYEAGVVSLNHLPALQDLTGLRASRLYGLTIFDCGLLKDLSGAHGLTTINSLVVSECAQLATASGLAATDGARNMSFYDDPFLQSIAGVLNLSQTYARIDLRNLPALKTLDGLQGLVKADALIVTQCDALADLTGLSTLQDINHLEINDCRAFKSLNGLSALERVNEIIQLESLPALTDLQGMQQLRAAGVVHLKELAQLTSVAGAEKLTAIGSLELLGNVGLQNLHGLEQLQSINGDLSVEDNRTLKSLEGVTLIELAGSLTLRNNSMLVDLKGLEHVTTIQAVTIDSNSVLPSVAGLEGLTSVVSFSFTNNMLLASLRGLASLTEIFDSMVIEGNRRLPQCEIEWLAKRVPFEVPPLDSNGPLGMCDP